MSFRSRRGQQTSGAADAGGGTPSRAHPGRGRPTGFRRGAATNLRYAHRAVRHPGPARMTGADHVIGLFPPGTVRDGDGMLRVGGCRLDELAAEYGTPALVVDEGAVRQQARDYRRQLAARWPDSRVAFASKAFPCTAVQRLMVSEGLWLDVAGGGEIVTALAAGADPATLILHGNAKTTEEIELAVSAGVGTGRGGQLRRHRPAGGGGAGRPGAGLPGPGDPRGAELDLPGLRHRPRGIEVRAGACRRAAGHRPDRGRRAAADGRPAHARRVADPGRGRAGRRGRAAGGARRVRRLRPRRRPRLPVHLRGPAADPGRRTSMR